MTTMQPPPQNLDTAAPYTARNRDRGPNYGRAEKYLESSCTASSNPLEQSLRDSLRRAQATRVACRAHYEARRRERNLPNETGYSRIRWLLHGIRDAESVDMMVNRDRMLDGIIVGARLFGNMRHQDADTLQALRMNAFDCRRRELSIRYEAALP